jgi:hypothetical protein
VLSFIFALFCPFDLDYDYDYVSCHGDLDFDHDSDHGSDYGYCDDDHVLDYDYDLYDLYGLYVPCGLDLFFYFDYGFVSLCDLCFYLHVSYHHHHHRHTQDHIRPDLADVLYASA